VNSCCELTVSTGIASRPVMSLLVMAYAQPSILEHHPLILMFVYDDTGPKGLPHGRARHHDRLRLLIVFLTFARRLPSTESPQLAS
jgi:hypothetical protein